MRLRIFAGCGLLSLALAACSQQQLAAAQTYSATACHVATAVELADPALAAHNTKVVNGVTMACDAAPVVLTLIPPTPPAAPAPTPPAQ